MLRRWGRWRAKGGVLRADVCIVSTCSLFALRVRLRLCVFVGVTIAPLGGEAGSLAALCSTFVLEQQRPFAVTAQRQSYRVRCRLWSDIDGLGCAIDQLSLGVCEQSRCGFGGSPVC